MASLRTEQEATRWDAPLPQHLLRLQEEGAARGVFAVLHLTDRGTGLAANCGMS